MQEDLKKQLALVANTIRQFSMEAVERARKIEFSRIEEQQRDCTHKRDWTELEKLKLRLLGLDNVTVNHNHRKFDSVSDDQLEELVVDEQ